jgi:transcriptional regulator GlxA family with amidase domain
MTLLAYPPKPVRSDQKMPVQSETTATAFERHYSVLEMAAMWSLSERTIRRMFDGEEGVVNWGHSGMRRKRAYQTLRIPESVMLRVYQRIRKAG